MAYELTKQEPFTIRKSTEKFCKMSNTGRRRENNCGRGHNVGYVLPRASQSIWEEAGQLITTAATVTGVVNQEKEIGLQKGLPLSFYSEITARRTEQIYIYRSHVVYAMKPRNDYFPVVQKYLNRENVEYFTLRKFV